MRNLIPCMDDVNEVPHEFSLDEINYLTLLLSDEMGAGEEEASDRQVESLAGVDVDIPEFHSSEEL
jgi:hypothetical protein